MSETFYRAVLIVMQAPSEGRVSLLVPVMDGQVPMSVPIDSFPEEMRDGLVPDRVLLGSVTLNAAADEVEVRELVFAPPVSDAMLEMFGEAPAGKGPTP